MTLGARPPRIALSGSAGVGKTTLGTALAESLGVPFVEEGMRARLEAGLDVHALDRDQHIALVEGLFDETGAALERAGDGFVADRSPIDFLAFWLYYGFAADVEATARFAARCDDAMGGVETIVVLPWGVIPLADDGIRTANPWRQLHYQALVEGLLGRRAAADKVHFLPPSVTDLEARVDWARTAAGIATSQPVAG
jgi:nicotinamide riboside kinase